MFDTTVTNTLKDRYQNAALGAEDFRMIVEVTRETLQFRDFLGSLRNNIERCILLMQVELMPEFALQLWRTSVSSLLGQMIGLHWTYIVDDLTVVEHAGLSTYVVKWKAQLVSDAEEVEAFLLSCHDMLDLDCSAESAWQLVDTLTAIDLVAKASFRNLIAALTHSQPLAAS